MRFVKNGHHLIAVDRIDGADYSRIDDLILTVTFQGRDIKITGIDAIESAMALRPSCLEGNPKLRWAKGAWHLHNLVGHPLTSILAMMGLHRWAFWVHDKTVPKPTGTRG